MLLGSVAEQPCSLYTRYAVPPKTPHSTCFWCCDCVVPLAITNSIETSSPSLIASSVHSGCTSSVEEQRILPCMLPQQCCVVPINGIGMSSKPCKMVVSPVWGFDFIALRRNTTTQTLLAAINATSTLRHALAETKMPLNLRGEPHSMPSDWDTGRWIRSFFPWLSSFGLYWIDQYKSISH